jgi:hypothetical protein
VRRLAHRGQSRPYLRRTPALDELHAPGFQIYFGGEGVKKGWLNAKREMAFAKVMQDGDVDGCMLMSRLPTKPEAGVIRRRLGIPKKRGVGRARTGTAPCADG